MMMAHTCCDVVLPGRLLVNQLCLGEDEPGLELSSRCCILYDTARSLTLLTVWR